MIKLDEKDLELINEFVNFLGENEAQDTEYPYVTEGLEWLKSIKDKTKEFKKMLSLYYIVYYEEDNPILYAEFNNNSVYLELKNGYVFESKNKDYINLAIKKNDEVK